MADVNFVTRRQAILLIVGLLLLVAVVIGLSRRMTKPIKALAGSAGRIATGDLDLELPTSQSEDEIGALTRAFGNMRDSLKTYIRNLKETSTSIASGSSLASRSLNFWSAATNLAPGTSRWRRYTFCFSPGSDR